MLCSIHQPNFFPYMGWWDKVKKSDVFVIMGHCQYEKNGYQNRFICNGEWYTMSTSKKTDIIYNKKYINGKDWHKIKTHFPKLEKFDSCIKDRLFYTNIGIIVQIAKDLYIDKNRFKIDHKTTLKGTDRLIDICKKNGCDEYLSGPSGKNYLELDKFDKAGIKVYFQEFKSKKSIIEELYV